MQSIKQLFKKFSLDQNGRRPDRTTSAPIEHLQRMNSRMPGYLVVCTDCWLVSPITNHTVYPIVPSFFRSDLHLLCKPFPQQWEVGNTKKLSWPLPALMVLLGNSLQRGSISSAEETRTLTRSSQEFRRPTEGSSLLPPLWLVSISQLQIIKRGQWGLVSGLAWPFLVLRRAFVQWSKRKCRWVMGKK